MGETELMSEPEPGIKASYFAGSIEALSALGHEAASRIRETMADELRVHQTMSRADYVPLAWDVKMTHAIHDLGGAQAVRLVNRRAFMLSFEAPLLRPIFQAARTLFGFTPKAFMKLGTKGWQVGTRAMGEMVLVALDEQNALVEHRNLPAIVRDDAIWIESGCGLFEGMFEASAYEGRVTCRVEGGVGVYDIAWWRP